MFEKIGKLNKGVKIVGIIILAILFLFSLRFIIGGSEDDWICVDGEWIKHGVPSAPKPTEPCGEIELAREVAGPIFKMVTRGGLCQYGGCWSEIHVKDNGEWEFKSGDREKSVSGQINKTKSLELTQLINSTEFNKLRESKFTGLCPTAYDGSENLYTFYTKNGTEEIRSCVTQIDPDWPLFKNVSEVTGLIFSEIYKN